MSEQNTTGTTPEPEAPAPPREERRGPRAVLRWTAAVLVFAAAAAGTAYGTIHAQRTDLPGLSTRGDGRWAYPVLAKPTLPAGAPLPKAEDNKERRHYAPLSALLLPAPSGARTDSGFKADKDAVVSLDAFLEEYAPDERAKRRTVIENEGLLQIAGRGWTMPDGTRSRVYLLRFTSAEAVDTSGSCAIGTRLAGAEAFEPDTDWSRAKGSQNGMSVGQGFQGSGTLSSSEISLYRETPPAGPDRTRLGCLQAGDVQAVIIHTGKGAVPVVPFHQTVILQSQLLS